MTKWERIEATPNDDRYFGYVEPYKEYFRVSGAELPKMWGTERQIIRKEENENENCKSNS